MFIVGSHIKDTEIVQHHQLQQATFANCPAITFVALNPKQQDYSSTFESAF